MVWAELHRFSLPRPIAYIANGEAVSMAYVILSPSMHMNSMHMHTAPYYFTRAKCITMSDGIGGYHTRRPALVSNV